LWVKVFRVDDEDKKLAATTVTGLETFIAIVAKATFTTRLEFGRGEASDGKRSGGI
jgi:hypothetical protein